MEQRSQIPTSLAIIAVVAIVIGVIVALPAPAPEPVSVSSVTADGSFYYPEGKFAFQPLANFAQLSADSVALPANLDAVTRFAFREKVGTCVLAYVGLAGNIYTDGGYDQTTPGTRVYLDEGQVDSWWLAPIDMLPEGFKTQFSGRLPLPGEISLAGYSANYQDITPADGRRDSFLLFDAAGGSVSDVCEANALEMYATLRPQEETTRLTATSTGALYDGSRGLHFLADGNTYSRRLEPNIHSRLTLVADGKLYYIEYPDYPRSATSSTETLRVFDPLTGTASDVPGITVGAGEVVNDFTVLGGKAFYTAGVSCTEYLAKCTNTLYEYDFATEKSRLLAGDLASLGVTSYDAAAGDVYLIWAFGDAGYAMQKYEIYSYRSGTVRDGGSRSTYSDWENPDKPEPTEEITGNYAEPVGIRSVYRNHVRVERGTLVEPAEDDPRLSSSRIRFAR